LNRKCPPLYKGGQSWARVISIVSNLSSHFLIQAPFEGAFEASRSMGGDSLIKCYCIIRAATKTAIIREGNPNVICAGIKVSRNAFGACGSMAFPQYRYI